MHQNSTFLSQTTELKQMICPNKLHVYILNMIKA